MKVMAITCTDTDGMAHTALFEDILGEFFVNGIQRAFDILVAERKRYQSITGR